MTNAIDPLLKCLEIFCQIKNITYPGDAVSYGIETMQGKIKPSSLVDMFARMGFDASVKSARLDKLISKEETPVILILKNNKAVVLKKIIDKESVLLVYPENPADEVKESMTNLAIKYDGFYICEHTPYRAQERSEEFTSHEKSHWFWSVVSLVRHIFPYVIFSSVLVNLFVLIIPIYIMNVYDRVVPYNAINTLWTFVIGALFFVTIDFVVKTMRGILATHTRQELDERMDCRLFMKTLQLRVSHEPLSPGGFVESFRHFQVLRSYLTSATVIALIDLPFIVFYLLVIAYIGGLIVLVPLVAIFFMVLINLAVQPKVNKFALSRSRVDAQRQAIRLEALTGLETIKTVTAEDTFYRHFQRCHELKRDRTEFRFLLQLASNMTSWIQQIAVVFVLVVGVYSIMHNTLTQGSLVACVILVGRSLSLGHMADLLFKFGWIKNAITHIDKLMAYPNERPEGKSYFLKSEVHGDISVDGLTHFYPGQNMPSLDAVSFKINQGEHVAIIGSVGAGKSTLLKIMVDLIKPSSGQIYIDDVDVGEIDPSNLRHHVQYVAADSQLFYGSVKENIKLANQAMSGEDFLQAAKIAGVDKIVKNHPMGFDMQVGERGQDLSAGQKQAVVIARALGSKASVLLLDESIANIDYIASAQLIKDIMEHYSHKTVILVTHRPSLLQFVDRVIHMDGGKIIFDGPKDEIASKLNVGD